MLILTEISAENINWASWDLVAELLNNAVHESIDLDNKNEIKWENDKAFFGWSKVWVLYLI